MSLATAKRASWLVRLDLAIPEVVYRSKEFTSLYSALYTPRATRIDPLDASPVPYDLHIFPGAVRGIFVPTVPKSRTVDTVIPDVLTPLIRMLTQHGSVCDEYWVYKQNRIRDCRLHSYCADFYPNPELREAFPVRMTVFLAPTESVIESRQYVLDPSKDRFETADLLERFGLVQ